MVGLMHRQQSELHRPAGAAMNSIKLCVTLFPAINYFIYKTLYHWGFPQISPKGGFVRFSWLLWTILSVPLLYTYTQQSSNLQLWVQLLKACTHWFITVCASDVWKGMTTTGFNTSTDRQKENK